jgi:hypothetical protein
MSRKNIDEIVLKNLALVPATVYNLAAFLSPNASTVKNALNWSDRLIKRLEGQRKIRRIPIKGQGGINNKKNSFYCLTHFGAKAIEYNKYQYRAPKSIDVLRHEVGLADILLGFIYGFPDYKVEIDYKRIFKLKRGVNYTPDAVVRLKNEETAYDFMVEFERSREAEEIKKEKFCKTDEVDFRKNGLSPNTKILFVFTTDTFDVFLRPWNIHVTRKIFK